jgi:hypothetical protein
LKEQVWLYFNGELFILGDEGLESRILMWHLWDVFGVEIKDVLAVSILLGDL